jgi:hypothetical protein
LADDLVDGVERPPDVHRQDWLSRRDAQVLPECRMPVNVVTAQHMNELEAVVTKNLIELT